MIGAPLWLDTMCFRFEDIRVDKQSQKLIDSFIGKDLCDIVCCFVKETVVHEGSVMGVPVLMFNPYVLPPFAITDVETEPNEHAGNWL